MQTTGQEKIPDRLFFMLAPIPQITGQGAGMG